MVPLYTLDFSFLIFRWIAAIKHKQNAVNAGISAKYPRKGISEKIIDTRVKIIPAIPIIFDNLLPKL